MARKVTGSHRFPPLLRRRALVAGTVAGGVGALAGCSDDAAPGAEEGRTTSPDSSGSTTATPPTTEPTTAPTRAPRVRPEDVRTVIAVRAVDHLAGEIGPRPAESPAYFRAARWVQGELEDFGWEVERQRFQAPAGFSWDTPVEGGRSVNVIATRGDVRPGRPWLLVGAHLDTVPRAPGAEDNASGIGVLLAVAQATAERRTRLPVVLVAFGAEEPRGEGDAHHHYGSRAYVAALSPAQRRGLRGAVSMDRVGVGDAVVIGSVEDGDPLRAELVAAAEAAEAPIVVESGQQSSDHWSFVREGMPGVRLGSTPYAAYHRPDDVPSVVDRAQLDRAARVVLAWLR